MLVFMGGRGKNSIPSCAFVHHRSYFKRKKIFFFLNPGFGGFVSELPPLVSIAPPEVMKLF